MDPSTITSDSSQPLLPTSLSAISNVTWAGESEGDDAPPKTGTIISSSMNLAACALGASMLSLPYTMMISGPIVALEFLVIFGIMAFFSANAIVNAGLRCQKSSYGAIVKYFFGATQGIIAEILLAMALIVAAISYIVGLVDLLPSMLPFTDCLDRTQRIITVLIALFPVTLISSLSAFGPASAIAAAGCYLQALALVAQLFTSSDWKIPERSVWTSVDLAGLTYSMPMICFVYAFHYVLTETLMELENPTRMRMSLVNFTTVGIMIGCYIPVAICGYLAFSGEGISTNLLEGLPNGSPTALIAKWSIGGLLLITYSLFIIPLRQKIEVRLFGELTKTMKDPQRIAIAAGLNIFVAIVSISLPDLGLANTLAGGCIALIMFYYPGKLMVQFQNSLPFEQRDPLRIGIGYIFIFFGTLICLVGLFGNMVFKF